MQSPGQPDNSHVKPLILLAAVLCLSSGCQFYNNVVVSKEGKVFPWRGHGDDPAAKAQWDKDLAKWQLEDAERRFLFGTMDRYEYNVERRSAGLEPID